MDRLPPHAPDAEAAIIGCCLSFPMESVSECQKVIVDDEFFYDHRNKAVWNVICNYPVQHLNAVYATEKLRSQGLLDKIGLSYLADCQDKATGPSFLSGWLEEAQEKHTARRLIHSCSNIISSVMTNGASVNSILDKAEKEILGIRANRSESQTIKELTRDALSKIEQRCEKGDAITGLPTGLVDLDKQSDGLHGGEMVVVAGFPSTGKTALAVNISVFNAMAQIPAAIFSAEMRPVQLVVRSICSESRVNFHKANYNDV